jgi:hypothetical protein
VIMHPNIIRLLVFVYLCCVPTPTSSIPAVFFFCPLAPGDAIEISWSCRLPSSGLFTFYTVRFTVCFMLLCTRKLSSPGGTNAQIHGLGSPGKPFAPWARHLRLASLMVSFGMTDVKQVETKTRLTNAGPANGNPTENIVHENHNVVVFLSTVNIRDIYIKGSVRVLLRVFNTT